MHITIKGWACGGAPSGEIRDIDRGVAEVEKMVNIAEEEGGGHGMAVKKDCRIRGSGVRRGGNDGMDGDPGRKVHIADSCRGVDVAKKGLLSLFDSPHTMGNGTFHGSSEEAVDLEAEYGLARYAEEA